MTARATRISLRTDVVAAGGSTLAILPDWLSCQWREALTGDFGSAQLILPADSLNVPYAAMNNVIRITDYYPDAGVDITREFRITGLHDGPHRNTVEVTAAPIIHDLGKVLVSQLVGGVLTYNLSTANQTPAQIITTYVLPLLAAAGYSWVVAGTIGGDPLTLAWQQTTVLGLLQLLQQQTDLELSLVRAANDANYAINLTSHTPVTDDTMPVAWVGRNVIALDRQITSDQRFFTRCIPRGVTPDGELEAPGIEQAVFAVSAVAGDTITITNPVSSYGPIGFDDQLNGLTVLTMLEPAPLHNSAAHAVTGQIGHGVAFDPSRNTVYTCSELPNAAGRRVYWFKLDDGTSGNFAVTGLDPRGIAYAPSSDRLYVVHDGGTLDVVNPATKTVVTTIAITGGTNPNKVRYIAGWDRIIVRHASGFDVINPNTNTRLGAIGSSISKDFVIYNAANTRVFTFSSGQPTFNGYNASTLASSGGGTAPASTTIVTAATDGTSIWCVGDVSGTKVGFTINPATSAVSGNTTIAPLGTVALAPMTAAEMWYSAATGKLYAISASWLYELTTAFVRTANVPVHFTDAYAQGWLLDGGTEYVFYLDGDARHIRILQTLTLAGYQRATVASSAGSSRASNQQFDRVAGSKGLTYAGQRLEVRQNSSLDYRPQLDDPAAIATYGQIEGVLPNADYVGRRNYCRAGSSDEWRSDNVEQYLATIDDVNIGLEARWRSSEETALVQSPCTTNGAYTAHTNSIALSGLGAGRILSPGDVLSESSTTPFGSDLYAVVMKRTVADGSGNATVPIWSGGMAGLSGGATVYLWSPAITALGALSTSDLIVLAPTAKTSPILTAYGLVPLPKMTAMTTAWVVARLLVKSLNGAPNVVALAASTDPSAFGTSEIAIDDSVAYNDGLCREYVLGQRVDLSGGGTHVAFRIRSTAAAGVVVYVKSLMVIHGAAAVLDHDIPVSGSSMLWALGNRALIDAVSPQVTYQVQAIEDDPAATSGNGVLALGKEIRLRDPARGVNATPRIIEITRSAVNKDQLYRQPVLTLATRPTSLVDSVVALET